MEKYLELTENQKSIIEKAIDLLSPLAKEEEERESRYTTYFKVHDEDVSSEYDTCDDDKCISEAKKEIRKAYGKGTHIEECYYDNDGDHESIERCSVCGRPLTSSLTWIEQEFDHHEQFSITMDDFKDGCTAFDVKVMLDAMPSCDHRITEYNFHQDKIGNPEPLKQAIKWQNDFVERVIKYAELVINVLSNNPGSIEPCAESIAGMPKSGLHFA